VLSLYAEICVRVGSASSRFDSRAALQHTALLLLLLALPALQGCVGCWHGWLLLGRQGRHSGRLLLC
jgi:hypothetical protein